MKRNLPPSKHLARVFALIIIFMMLVLAIASLRYYTQAVAFNNTPRTLEFGKTSSDVSLDFGPRGGASDSWVKNDVYINGEHRTFTGTTYDATLTNDSSYPISDWTLKFVATTECYINCAWCGTLEIHQDAGTIHEYTQTIDLRSYDASDLRLQYIYGGTDLMITLKPGDYFIYHPLASANELPVGPAMSDRSTCTVGFIFYYEDLMNVSATSIDYRLEKSTSMLTYKDAVKLLYIFSIIILLYLFLDTLSRRQPRGIFLALVFLGAIFSILANLIILSTDSIRLASICYSLFYSSVGTALALLFVFVLGYKSSTPQNKLLERITLGAAAIDALSLWLNIFSGHAYTVIQTRQADGALFCSTEPHMFFYAHLFVSYVYICATFIYTLYRSLKTASIYKAQYQGILAGIIVLIIFDALYLYNDSYMNLSVVMYAVVCFFDYYIVSKYIPTVITNNILGSIMKNTPEMMLFFDFRGICVYQSPSALNFFGNAIGRDESVLHDINIKLNTALALDVQKTYKCKYVDEYGSRYLDATVKELADNKGRQMGILISILDNTQDVIRLENERYRATHDTLTNLYTHEYFCELAAETIANNPDTEFYMVTSNIKHFKLINEFLGRDTGDKILKRLADIVVSKSYGLDAVCRIYADHYGMIIPKHQFQLSNFINNSENLVESANNMNIPIQVQFGIYEVTDPSLPIELMLDYADFAMQQIKDNTLRRYAFYDDALHQQILHNDYVTRHFDRALANGEFIPYLQPQVNTDGSLSGAEVLIRWKDPEKGLISPGDFLPVYEKNGLIAKVDVYIWEQACKILKNWKERGINYHLSVNISMADFLIHDLSQIFISLTDSYGIAPESLHLEITETLVISNLDDVLATIEKLHQAGFIVEMDDFGSGYSSLNSLKNIPVDVLKMDMAFLRATDDLEKSQIILTSMLKLAKELQIPVISEGVETIEQVEFLKDNGTSLFQGYYFSKPIAYEEFEDRYLS